MGKYEKLLLQILQGSSDRNIPFDNICKLLEGMGFEMRIRGSHHMFSKDGVEELINLQRMGDKAKPYQIRQIRQIFMRNRMAGE